MSMSFNSISDKTYTFLTSTLMFNSICQHQNSKFKTLLHPQPGVYILTRALIVFHLCSMKLHYFLSKNYYQNVLNWSFLIHNCWIWFYCFGLVFMWLTLFQGGCKFTLSAIYRLKSAESGNKVRVTGNLNSSWDIWNPIKRFWVRTFFGARPRGPQSLTVWKFEYLKIWIFWLWTKIGALK